MTVEIPVPSTTKLLDQPSFVVSILMISDKFALNEVRSTERKATFRAQKTADG